MLRAGLVAGVLAWAAALWPARGQEERPADALDAYSRRARHDTERADPPALPPGMVLSEPMTLRVRYEIAMAAGDGGARNLVAAAPVPIEWPDQRVRLIEQETSPGVSLDYEVWDGAVGQMVVRVPALPAGGTCSARCTLEIVRYRVRLEVEPDDLRPPDPVPRAIRPYLGQSPGIDTSHARVRQLARELAEGHDSAWDQAEAFRTWIVSNLEYIEGEFRGATRALAERAGDCEDFSALFIALCRTSGIPARTVWLDTHCYPEIYLEDSERNGYWLPIEVTGPGQLGRIDDYRPILQRGDGIRVPGRSGRVRYAEARVRGVGRLPEFEVNRELLEARTGEPDAAVAPASP